MSAATKSENQVFLFDDSATIGNLLNVVKALTNAGQTPKLRLVKSYNGEFESVAVDAEVPAPSGEMAVAGHEEDAPDPATFFKRDRKCDCGAPTGFEGFHAFKCAIYAGVEPTGFAADSLVWFEGSISRWSDLMLQDRKAYMAGGYPF